MEIIWHLFAVTGAAVWVSILLLPWRPWSTRESLDAPSAFVEEDLSDTTVLIPARNEADMIQRTLPALKVQGPGLRIILVDDNSIDGTAQAARRAAGENLLVVSGEPLPPGWSGKLWALEQGRRHIRTPLTLLLDADIEPRPGIIAALRKTMKERGVHLISLMVTLRMQTFWEKLLCPPFVFFFKLLYPFRLSNAGASRVAAAAGGCILLETKLLDEIGGFKPLRAELIDDCALARKVKSMGYRTWLGLTHSLSSLRPYDDLETIWNMVARTAFRQLHYSGFLLVLCTLTMLAAFLVPVVGLLFPAVMTRFLSAVGLGAMILTYLPTLKFYGISGWWALTMPLVGMLYLAMTWTSAIRHWLGRGSQWKDRVYVKREGF